MAAMGEIESFDEPRAEEILELSRDGPRKWEKKFTATKN